MEPRPSARSTTRWTGKTKALSRTEKGILTPSLYSPHLAVTVMVYSPAGSFRNTRGRVSPAGAWASVSSGSL